MVRALMTDTLELLRAPQTTTGYGEKVYDFDSVETVWTGLGSYQLYFSAEYDLDRDTTSRIGRVIVDDPTFNPHPKDWIRINGSEVLEVDGEPMVWTLRGRHHIEQGVKRISG
jgi:hypothetical protein